MSVLRGAIRCAGSICGVVRIPIRGEGEAILHDRGVPVRAGYGGEAKTREARCVRRTVRRSVAAEEMAAAASVHPRTRLATSNGLRDGATAPSPGHQSIQLVARSTRRACVRAAGCTAAHTPAPAASPVNAQLNGSHAAAERGEMAHVGLVLDVALVV